MSDANLGDHKLFAQSSWQIATNNRLVKWPLNLLLSTARQLSLARVKCLASDVLSSAASRCLNRKEKRD
jgi:hypothetical protein